MKISELILTVASLVEERKIINHGSIKCLYSDEDARDIQQAEGCDEVDTGIIGDNELSQKLTELIEDGTLGDIHFDALLRLEIDYIGDRVEDYIRSGEEDELKNLRDLIKSARNLLN
jgi:hypothetical protein